MNWSIQRRIMYGGAVLFFIIAFVLYVYRETLFPSPTCFDTVKNGTESGIDCGGVCSLRCASEVIPITVSWTRSISTSSTTYDFVAMASNKNIDNAPRALPYVFIAYDNQGLIIKTITGTTTAIVDGDFPIVIQDVYLPQEPKDVIATVTDGPHFSVAELPTSPTLRITQTRYEAGSIPRVYSTIVNTKRLTVSNLPIRVLLYNSEGNVIEAGETKIPFLDKEESKEIVFTWNRPFGETPTRILVYPIFDPFLVSK